MSATDEHLPLERQLWLMSEVGSIHMCCGSWDACSKLADRYLTHHVASRAELGECCEVSDGPCAFDMFGDDYLREQLVLSLALARAEGRPAAVASLTEKIRELP